MEIKECEWNTHSHLSKECYGWLTLTISFVLNDDEGDESDDDDDHGDDDDHVDDGR